MTFTLIFILFVAFLAIGAITVGAIIFQRWYDSRDASSPVLSSEELRPLEYREFEEKLKAQPGSDLSNTVVKILMPVPNSEDKIVMLDFRMPSQNLLRCRPDGSLVWKAELPTSQGDVYTQVEWKDQKLQAFSGSCYAVILDLEKGQILSSEFTK